MITIQMTLRKFYDGQDFMPVEYLYNEQLSLIFQY